MALARHWWECSYRRAVREVALLRERWIHVRALSFNIDAFSSRESLALFRFLPHHVGQLAVLLQVDVPFSYPQYAVSPVECLCIVLRRLASPARWTDLEELFGRSRSALCNIFVTTLEVIMSKCWYLLKLRETPVGLLCKAGALVWNLRCCAYGRATSTFFSCSPPTWSQYLGLPAAGVGNEGEGDVVAVGGGGGEGDHA